MVDLVSILKMAPEAVRNRKHKRTLLFDFVLDAIGLRECLTADSHEFGTVSLATIDLRMHLLQESEPDRARKLGVPAIGDVMRKEK